jgi:hypothetical protein
MKRSNPERYTTEEILSSIEGMRRADAPPFLLTHIERRIDQGARENTRRLASPALIVVSAGCFALLLGLNSFSLELWHIANSTQHTTTQVQSDYQLNSTVLDLY